MNHSSQIATYGFRTSFSPPVLALAAFFIRFRIIRRHADSIPGTDANLHRVWETKAAIALTRHEGLTQA